MSSHKLTSTSCNPNDSPVVGDNKSKVKKTKINVIQANVQHSVTGSAALRRTLEEQPNTIALVQEPYISRGKVSGFNTLKGNTFVPPIQNKSRTMVYIPKKYEASLVPHLCTDDLTVVRLQTGLEGTLSTIIVGSLYMDITAQAPSDAIEELAQFCASNNLEYLVACDSNAHCTVWGSMNTNERGKDVLDFILRYDLNILNRGQEPTFVTSRARTVIDITLATNGIAAMVEDWHVATEDASCADHRRIRFQLTVGEKEARTYRNPKKTDRGLFREALAKNLNEMASVSTDTQLRPHDIEDLVTKLGHCLKSSYETSCPLKTERDGNIHKKDRWWNRDLRKLRKKTRHHFNRAMNTNDEKDWQEYRQTRHQFKVNILKSSKNSLKKYTTAIQSESETARLRKLLAGCPQTKLGTLKKPDGSYTISDQEQFKLLLQTHFPDCLVDSEGGWEPDTPHEPTVEDWAFADAIVTDENLQWAVSNFQPYKAAGTDGIFPALLHWSLHKIKNQLIAIFRSCLAWKYIPTTWREVKVVFLPKPGKTDYTNPKSFRPISLSSFLLKTLERLCDKYIRSEPLKQNQIHHNQHAYQSGKSTETALHQVVYKIETALENKQSCLVTFIDIEGAFDKTTFLSIDNGLRNRGVNENLNGWIKAMLSNRVAHIEGSSDTRCLVTRGCPQGGVLSPLLWTVVVNELITLLNKDGILTIGYADDLAIMISGLFEATLCDKMQRALRIVENWCRQHNLSVNPQKTEMVLFTRKIKLPELRLPTLFGVQVSLSKEVKYLGIWLDSKLLWGKHLDHIITKATNILWQSTKAVGKDWGLKPKLCRWLYTVIVRPVLTYGCVVWWPRTNLVTTITKLQQLQRLACSLISSCARTTPSAALEVILGLTPLHLHIQQEAMASALRLKSTNEWKDIATATNHSRILQRAVSIVPEASKGTDRIANKHLDNKKYNFITTDTASAEYDETPIKVYLDGAKNKTGAGCGYYSPKLGLETSIALTKTTTTLQSEATALLLAARAILPRGTATMLTEEKVKKSIEFITDSAAVLYALRRPTTRSRIIAECHDTLQHLAENYYINIRWTKSHSSCPGNDKADKLAKEGTKKQVSEETIVLCKPTAMEVRDQLQQYTEREQQKLWDKRIDCSHAKAAFPKLNRKLTNNLLKLKRQDLRLIVSLITGHCNLNYHMHKVGATDSSLCRGCMQEEETVEHVIAHCTATAQIRASSGMQDILSDTKVNSDNHILATTSSSMSSSLELVCQQPKATLRYVKELGWLG